MRHLISKIKDEWQQWNLLELCWLAGFTLVAIVLSILWEDNLFGLLVFVTGVLCVVLTAKGRLSSYLFGIFNTLGYAWIAWNNQLFGEMGLNLFFFLPTGVIGFFLWRNNIAKEQTLVMRALSRKVMLYTALAIFLSVFTLGFALSLIPTQNTPYIDATTNVLSIAATLLTMGRYREQWLVYIVLNLFTVLMWVLRAIQGSPDGMLMIVMWSAYLVNAVYGYFNWSKGVRAAMQL